MPCDSIETHLYFSMFEKDEDAGSTQQSAQPFAELLLIREARLTPQTFMPQIENRKIMQPSCWEFITHLPESVPAFIL